MGRSIPASIFTHICDKLNKRRGKTGIAVNGMPRLFAIK